MSDSDSGSSTSSWVFVDENNPSDVNSPNQFYLNCSGEPVQELEENDLGVVVCDSDSDGISVISETEESLIVSSSDDLAEEFVINRSACRERNDAIENIGSANAATQQKCLSVNENSINLKKLFITSSLIGAGVVVVAILIAPYITPKANSDIIVDDVSVEIPKKYHSKSREPNHNLHCQGEHKRKHLSVSFSAVDKLRNDSKKYSKYQQFKMQEDDGSKYTENDYQVKYSAYKIDDIKHANSIEREDNGEKVLYPQNKRSKKRNKDDESSSCEGEFKNKEKKLKAKEEYLAKKEEYLIKKEYELLRKKIKLERKISKYHRSELGENEYIKNHFKSKKYKKQVKAGRVVDKETESDGEWYANIHKYRDETRKREHMSDWMFDRASDRAKRRDDARWYFQWMVGREEGRFRRPLRRQHA